MTPEQAVSHFGGIKPAARALGIPYTTFHRQLKGEKAKAPKYAPNILTFPTLPDRREPIVDLIDRRTKHYKRQKAFKAAATWQAVAVSERKPIALCFVGDPHIDDDGCAWTELQDDIAIMRETPGMYGLNIGDTTNNWVGRLARLFGNQETSQTSARQLAEWFLTKAGIKWAAVVLGNHDEWNEGGEIIKRMCAAAPTTIPVHEWAAKLEFVFPNGATCRVSASHDFKGRSIYSTTHGLLREAIWHQDRADILVAGHIHYGGLQQVEIPGGHTPWLIRARGYKDFDPHALVNGYHEGRRFRSVAAIIDPDAAPHERVSVFGSLQQAAVVLKAMRGTPAKRARRAASVKSSRKTTKRSKRK